MCKLPKKFTVLKALRNPCFLRVRIKRFVLLKYLLFLHYIFPVENPFFVNAGSALHKVSNSLWSAFKQVWQQAASLLSSWCNHLKRSNHAVWNDLFVVFLLPKVFEIFRLVWTSWYVYKALIWRAELRLCRFQFASYCCGWLQIIFISGLLFGSGCFVDVSRLFVTGTWFYAR